MNHDPEPAPNRLDDPRDAQLDALLRDAYAPPPADALVAAATAATRTPPSVVWQGWLAAAALLLTVLSWFLLRQEPAHEAKRHDGTELGAMWAAAYQHAVANREGADGKRFCCDPSLDFCGTCEQRFAVRLGFAGQASVQLRGCYCGLPTGASVAALVDTEHGPVGVFVLSRDQDPGACLPAGCSLQLARRELGSLVLYGLADAHQPDPGEPLAQFALAP